MDSEQSAEQGINMSKKSTSRILRNCLSLCAAPGLLLLCFLTNILFFFLVQAIIQGSCLVLAIKIGFLPRQTSIQEREEWISLWVGCAIATGFIYYIWANATSFR